MQMGKYIIGIKFRAYPNKEQQNLINCNLGCCRFVYNHFLEIRKTEWMTNRKNVNYNMTCSMLTNLKKYADYDWLKQADIISLQQSLRDLEKAYQKFFKGKARYPRFKSKHRHRQTYRTMRVRVVKNAIRLPKIGFVKIKQSREINGKIINATVSHMASGKYFITLCVEVCEESIMRSNNGGVVGIDVGIKEFYSDSNGNKVNNPKVINKWSRKLAREQRKMARKMPHSINREKARVRVAKVYERIANVRKDFLHKASTALARQNKLIAIEHLKIANMMKNHNLARAISDVSWGMFFKQLEYKAEFYGVKIIKIDTYYPSSQTCSECGYQNKKMKKLTIRKWICPKCGAHHNRDINAAKNILNRALSI
jgi:putative transposase